MGKRGKIPLPAAEKQRRGTYRKDRSTATAPRAKGGMPTCPGVLTDGAKREWKRVAPRLYDLGLLTHLDRGALSIYVDSWDRWVTALKALKDEDMVVTTPNGGMIQNPYIGIANRASEKARVFGGLFGLNPSARPRISVTPPESEKGETPSGKKVVSGYFQ